MKNKVVLTFLGGFGILLLLLSIGTWVDANNVIIVGSSAIVFFTVLLASYIQSESLETGEMRRAIASGIFMFLISSIVYFANLKEYITEISLLTGSVFAFYFGTKLPVDLKNKEPGE